MKAFGPDAIHEDSALDRRQKPAVWRRLEPSGGCRRIVEVGHSEPVLVMVHELRHVYFLMDKSKIDYILESAST